MQTITLTKEQKKEHQNMIKYFEEEYKFKFFNPAFTEVPHVSQFFNNNENKESKESISNLEQYLLGSYPIDMGTNIHDEMRDIKQSLTKEKYEWLRDHNKLGKICIYHAGMGLFDKNLLLKRNDLHIDFSKEGYSLLTFEEKRKLCSDIDKKLYSILEKLYTDYSQTNNKL